jgi:GT2 family glycosyltransferase
VSPNNTQGQHVVTAVIVAHDGAAWLPRMAEALLRQTRPVQRVVAVDTGSQDRSGAVLAGLLGRSVVFGMDRATGYGAAVGQALRHRAANTHVPGPAGLPQGERVEWVWLLHDDCEPAPDALEQLLLGAAEARSAAVLGPKVMDWADRRVILETGITIDGAGRRITGIEPREVDQGQHDGDRDVLAVGSAGMLVRRDAWDQVGGFDQGIALFREDVDFCWRIHAAGYRVRVVTDAVIYHLEAAARNRRVASAAPRPQRTDRQNALMTLLGNLPTWPALVALVSNLTLSVLRTIFFLLAKRPAAALDESAAFALVAGHPLRVLSARRRRAQGRRSAYSRLRANLPRGRSMRRLAEFAASALSRSSQLDTAGSHHATDDPNDDDTLLVDTGLTQRIMSNPGVLLFAALSVIALVAERTLLGSGPLSGGALLPAWGGASGLWHEYLQGFHPTGIGSTGVTPPYVAVLATLASLLGGKPWLAVDVIMVGSVPLAGLAAFFAARRVTESVLARVWAGAAYALLPVGMGAVAAGRLGAAVAFTLIPLIGVVAARIFTAPKRRAKRAAWATGLLVTIAAAFVPLMWVAAVLAAGLGALAFGRSRRGILLDLGLVALVPPVLLMPWTLQVAAHPALAFLDAGHQVPGLASAHLSTRSLLLLSPGGPGLPPYWVTAGLALAALSALLLTGRRTLVTAGWCIALLGLLISVGVSRVLVTPQGGGPAIPAWPGISLAIAAAGLLLAATVAAGTVRARLADGKWHGTRGLGVGLLALVACSAPLLAAGSWLVTGVRGPVGVSAGPVLPAFVSVSSDTGQRLRTLVLRSENGQLTYSVLRGADPLIGATELTMPSAARQALDTAVATLVAPSGGDAQDQGRAMAAFDIGYVLLPAPVDAGLARLLDGVPTLRPVSETSAFELWRVAETMGRAQVIQPRGTVVPVAAGPTAVSGAAAPAAGGTLVLAEPAGGWTATLNGHPLAPLAAPVGGWAQGFRLPPGGGRLDIGHNDTGRYLIVALEAIAMLAVAALGLPGARNAAESVPEAAVEPGAGRRHSGRAKDRARPGSRDKASDQVGGRRLARRRKNAPDVEPVPGRPGPAWPGTAARLPGEAARRGSAPAEQRDPAAAGRRGALADVAPDARGGLADLGSGLRDARGAPADVASGGRRGVDDLGSGPRDVRGGPADVASGGRRGLDDLVRSPAVLRGGLADPASGGRRGLDDRGSGLADARGGPTDGRSGPTEGRSAPTEARGGSAGRRGGPAGGGSAPADGREVPVNARGGAPWDEKQPPAGRTGRPRLGHRSPAPADQGGPAPADQGRPAPADKRGPASAVGRGGPPGRGSPVDGRGGVPWDEPQPPAGRPGRRGTVPEDSRGPVLPGSRGPLDDRGGARRDGRQPAVSQAGRGRAGRDSRTDRPDAAPASAKPASPRKGRFWGRRGRPSPDQRDEPAWDGAGPVPRGGLPGRGQPAGGSPRGGVPRGGRPSGGLPGSRPAADRPAADRPATDRPVSGGRSRPAGDRRGTPRTPRPDRAPVTRGRLPGDDEALPALGSLAPLAPLPPPLPRSASAPPEDGYPDSDGVHASWRSDAQQEPGEVDW